jgi:hypothetical protein
VKALLLACLPVAVAGMIWMLLGQPPSDEPAVAARQVRAMLAADSSGNGHDGIIQGDVKTGLPGFDGNAFSFTARDAWIQVPSSPGINPADQDFLLTARVNLLSPPGPGETYDVVRKGLGYTFPGEFKLEVMGRGSIRCTAKDEHANPAVATSPIVDVADGSWHLIGCARVGQRWGVLVDGTWYDKAIELGSVSNTVALSIGGKYGYEDRPEGTVDDVRLSFKPSALPEQEDFEAGVKVMEQEPPEAWWRLDEATVTVPGR